MSEASDRAIRGAHYAFSTNPVFLREIVDGVISQLREPTTAMLAAGEKAMSRSGPIYDYNAKEVWQAMLDEIMK